MGMASVLLTFLGVSAEPYYNEDGAHRGDPLHRLSFPTSPTFSTTQETDPLELMIHLEEEAERNGFASVHDFIAYLRNFTDIGYFNLL